MRSLIGMMPPHDGSGDVVDWDSVEEALGASLPSDFRDFVAVYGAGSIDDQVEIASLEAGESDRVDIPTMTLRASSERWIEETGSDYPLWPEPGSLIGWGRLKSYGQTYGFLYWRSAGPDPDRWPVVVWKRGGEGFVEHPYGMAEFLVRTLQEAGSLPLERRDVFGAPHSRFVHQREEERLNAEGIDPWEYLDDLHEELDDPANDVAVEITSPGGGSTAYRRDEVPAELSADLARLKEHRTAAGHHNFRAVQPEVSAVEVPQLAFLGIGLRDGTLSITASIALGSPDCGPLLLSAPFRLSVRASGPQGEEEVSVAEVPTVPTGALAVPDHVEITKDRPYTFSVDVPASEPLWGRYRQLLDRTSDGASLVMSITDEGVGAFRTAAKVAAPPGSENTLLAAWPPRA
ncbi:hypothetical protein ACWDRR_33360 [Kitasatospora sp. NPDC003701]